MLHLSITRPAARAATVCLAGELDCAGVHAVAGLVRSLEGELDVVVLDVSDLTFVDVAGTRALDGAVADLATRGITAELRGMSVPATRLRDLLAELRVAS